MASSSQNNFEGSIDDNFDQYFGQHFDQTFENLSVDYGGQEGERKERKKTSLYRKKSFKLLSFILLIFVFMFF